MIDAVLAFCQLDFTFNSDGNDAPVICHLVASGIAAEMDKLHAVIDISKQFEKNTTVELLLTEVDLKVSKLNEIVIFVTEGIN